MEIRGHQLVASYLYKGSKLFPFSNHTNTMKSFTLLFSFLLITLLTIAQKPSLILPVGHTDAVNCIAYSKDAQWLASGSKDRTVKLWNKDGRLIYTYPRHDREIVDIVFSPDMQYLVSRSENKLYLWTLNGDKVWESEVKPTPPNSEVTTYSPPSFSKDGEYLLFADSRESAILYHIPSRQKRPLLCDQSNNLQFSPSDEWIMSAADGKILLYSKGGRIGAQFPVLDPQVPQLQYFAANFLDDNHIAVAYNYTHSEGIQAPQFLHQSGGFTKIFNIRGQVQETLGKVIKVNADGTFNLSGLNGNTGRMEEENFLGMVLGAPVVYASTGGPIGQIGTMRWSDALLSKNKQKLVISYEKMTSIWDMQTGQHQLLEETYPIGFSHDDSVLGLIKKEEVPPSENGNYQSQRQVKYKLVFYRPNQGKHEDFSVFSNLSAAFPIGGWPISASFSPIAQRVTLGYSNGKIATWDFSGKLIQEFGGNSANEILHCEVDQEDQSIINFYFTDDNTDISQPNDHIDSDTLKIRFSLSTGVLNADLHQGKVPFSKSQYEYPTSFYSESSKMQIATPLQPGLDGKYAAPSVNSHGGIVTITQNGEEVANFYEGYGITDIGLVNDQYLLLSKAGASPTVLDLKKILALAQDPSNVIKRDLYGMATVDILKDDLRSQFVLHETTSLPNFSEQLDWSDEIGLVLIKPYDTWKQINKLGVNQYQEAVKTNLIAYSPSQQKSLGFQDVHDLKILGAQFFEHGRFAISWSRDHSCKIWDVNSGEKLFTLFWLNDQDWIALAPNGLFDASAGVMDLLYYTTNQEVIELEQLKARYYEPGLIQKLLGYSKERIRPVDGLDNLLLFPEMINSKIENDLLSFQLKARNGGIGRASIAINGKEIVEEVNPESEEGKNDRATSIQFDLKPYQSYLLKGTGKKNTITIHTYNAEGWLKSPAYNIDYQASARTRGSGSSSSDEEAELADPKLYVISIGTSDYTGDKLDLQYADQDATTMARALNSIGTTLFSSGDSLEVYCFTTANKDNTGLENTSVNWQFADKKNIRRTFRKIKDKAKAEDVILVYLSGHGVAYGTGDIPQFHYLTQGIADENLSDAEIRKAYTISSDELTRWLNNIPALKQVLIIDACNSGQVVENITGGTKNLNSSQIRAIDRMKDRTGMFVLSGSAADKVSYEASEYGQGLLTYALLQGMLGVATRKTADGDYVDVMKLFQYARDEVPRLAESINGIQTPMMGFPKQGASFDIGIVNDQVNIPIGNKKPVIVRSNFMNKNSYLDDASLASALEIEFREETEKGKNADFIYVDVYDYPAAYSLNGLYEKDAEGNIIVKVKMYKDKKEPVDLNIRPTNNSKKLAKFLLRALKKELEK